MSDMPRAPIRALVVEDRPAQVLLITKMLEAAGCVTEAANEAHSAIELLGVFKPQVIFLDIGLPNIDGYQLAEMIRAEPEFKSLPIVAVTGYGFNADKERSKQAGIDLHLVK